MTRVDMSLSNPSVPVPTIFRSRLSGSPTRSFDSKCSALLRGLNIVFCGLAVGSLTVGCVGCGPSSPTSQEPSAPETAEKPRIAATTYPLGFVVEYLAQDLVNLEVVVPPDGDPAHDSPTTEQILDLQTADLVISHGLGYERWMTTASLPESKIIRTANSLNVVKTSGRTHSHGNQGEHSHTEVDPMTWMDPSLFRKQAETVQQSLAELWPELGPSTEERLGILNDQLRSIDDELEDLLGNTGAADRVFRATEPERYGYWQRKLGFQLQRTPQEESPELLWIAPSNEKPTEEALPGDKADNICAARIDVLDRPGNGGTYDYLIQANGNLERLSAAFERCPDSST